jgi:hypothetical protein
MVLALGEEKGGMVLRGKGAGPLLLIIEKTGCTFPLACKKEGPTDLSA